MVRPPSCGLESRRAAQRHAADRRWSAHHVSTLSKKYVKTFKKIKKPIMWYIFLKEEIQCLIMEEGGTGVVGVRPPGRQYQEGPRLPATGGSCRTSQGLRAQLSSPPREDRVAEGVATPATRWPQSWTPPSHPQSTARSPTGPGEQDSSCPARSPWSPVRQADPQLSLFSFFFF